MTVFSILSLLSACGPTLPPELENPYQNPHPECNPDTHYMAKGVADSPQGSRAQGKREISEQIQAQLVSETNILTEFQELVTINNGVENTSSVSTEELQSTINIQTSFSHVELIKTIVPPQEYKGQFYSLSCLDRAEAGKVLVSEAKDDVDHFLKLGERALELADAGNVAGFSVQFAKAAKLRHNIVPDLYVIRSITGKQSSVERKFRNMWRDLDDRATDIRTGLAVGIQMKTEGIPDLEMQQIRTSIQRGFQDTGLKVLDAEACESSMSHVAVVDVQANCGAPGTMGIICKPILQVSLESCSNHEKLTVSLSDKQFQGQDYYSAEKAVHNAYRKLDSISFGQTVSNGLGGSLPLSW